MTSSAPQLYRKIQEFYDASSGLWESVWGEHMHHGYYGPEGKLKKDRRQAQIDLIEALLDWAGVDQATNILDVGCGIGGSTLQLARQFNAQATGITLSPKQAQRARQRAASAGIAYKANFQVANALEMPFADDRFDLVWSLESGEHMPDKEQFLRECCRVLKPGGVLVVATWCHRDGPPALTVAEEQLLSQVYELFHLPYVISLAEYGAIARSLPLYQVQSADWSKAVAPFWDVVIDSAMNPQALLGLLGSGWTTIRGALALEPMQRGLANGTITYGMICGRKL
jgi:tocopherol O-methyltransferase